MKIFATNHLKGVADRIGAKLTFWFELKLQVKGMIDSLFSHQMIFQTSRAATKQTVAFHRQKFPREYQKLMTGT